MDTDQESQPHAAQERKDNELIFKALEKAFRKKYASLLQDFQTKHNQFVNWLDDHQFPLSQIQQSLTQGILATGLTAIVLTSTSPSLNPSQSPPTIGQNNVIQNRAILASLAQSKTILLDDTNPASDSNTKDIDTLLEDVNDNITKYLNGPSNDQEFTIANLLSLASGITVTPELSGYRMNKMIGYFGKEQHLYRYPGDTLEQHANSDADRQLYQSSGIAPGLGAWGYFAPSKQAFTKEDEQRERYYIAAQTFLFPGYQTDPAMRKWLKFRKVMVYNPKNGKAAIAVIGDAGPATWTGKSFGGSPELMHYLNMVDGKQKGQAVVLFVDDANSDIPLGPINLKEKDAI